ncbi:hypothetical protein [Paraburkholderia aspalathi]|uniref:hypothetical protein n=1 Tax=Paraburkholderia aspalathi TaxID=1324617 RepID=UPI003CC7F033
MSGIDLDEPVDWRREDDDLPAVYLLVRALVQTDATNVATQDYVPVSAVRNAFNGASVRR